MNPANLVDSLLPFIPVETVSRKPNANGLDSSNQSLFLIPKQSAEAMLTGLNVTIPTLLVALAHFVKRFAITPVSTFDVGAVGLCADGDILLGVNIEFSGLPLMFSIHAEQCLISLAHRLKRTLTHIATTAMPCGHCRQFMKELKGEKELQICYVSATTGAVECTLLSQLLPLGFGPADLLDDKSPERVLESYQWSYKLSTTQPSDALLEAATDAVNRSFCPYTGCPSALAGKTTDGSIYVGTYLESAAYNPSLSPIHSFVACLWGCGKNFNDVDSLVFLEKQSDGTNTRYITQKHTVSVLKENVFSKATLLSYYVD